MSRFLLTLAHLLRFFPKLRKVQNRLLAASWNIQRRCGKGAVGDCAVSWLRTGLDTGLWAFSSERSPTRPSLSADSMTGHSHRV
jgi:hypothetical protein